MYPKSHVSAVHYNLTESRETQIRRHNVVQDDGSRKSTQNWRGKVKVSDKYYTYSDDVIEMLTDRTATLRAFL